MIPIWVNRVSGVPLVRDFNTTFGNGPCLVVDTTGPTLYYLAPGDVVTALGGGGGGGTVTSVSVVSANGFAGSVATPTTTPAITISTTISGLIKGNGAAISTAVAATDYVAPSLYASTNGLTLATSRLLGRTTAATGPAEEISVSSPITLSALSLSFDQTVILGNNARVAISKNSGATVGTRRRLNFIEGSNITLTIADDAGNEKVDVTISASGGGGGGNVGSTTVNFGAFPGTPETSVTVTGQAGILAGSVVRTFIMAVATADHSADEHWVEQIEVLAGNIVPGTGFTIYAKASNQLPAPSRDQIYDSRLVGPGRSTSPNPQPIGNESRLYGQFTVGWAWT